MPTWGLNELDYMVSGQHHHMMTKGTWTYNGWDVQMIWLAYIGLGRAGSDV